MADRRRGRPREFDRDAVLQVILREFWEHGYETTSFPRLTKATGIGAPSLYAAFGDKEALFDEVVQTYGRTYGDFSRRALAEEPTARRAVARMLRDAAAEYTATGHPPGCLVTSAATNVSDKTAAIAERLRGYRNQTVQDVRDKIQADIDAARLPATVDAARLARFSSAVMQGMSQQARDGASRADLEAIAATAMDAWPAEATV
ncbi:TetR/AcrR family transcriptional regulator [Actinomadura rupiterrae]|uniref:TetR/AcrR family transcriptional regulator n=1 Tax=Actinomadura rupiterrae TaxID=559627 RepID=UPI0020A40974|nr:TetR/AcrR family transcriptional regulator [Actinomadura rupiterrae]MCP2337440.1 AcrR family transcriptional regulator [Actinomadura rupiterrae]